MKEFLFVPIDPNGFEVDSEATYNLIAYHLTKTAGQIALCYPDKEVLVIWPVRNE